MTVLHYPGFPAKTNRQLGIDLGALSSNKTGARLAMALGFFAYLPYPAIPVGNNSAIQIGNLLTILMVLPAIALPWRRKPFLLYPVLVVPLLISAIKVCAVAGDPLIGFKLAGVWIFSMLAMVATQLYAPRYSLQFMAGIAVCALLHTFIGVWQLIAFQSNYLPLEGLYINPSFASIEAGLKAIVTYEQRPFGLFPEPSAMASSLGPWILFWFALGAGVVTLRTPVSRAYRILFVTAATASLGLVLISRSGHSVFILAGLGVIVFLWVTQRRRSAVTLYGILVVAVGILLPLMIWILARSVQSRMDSVHGETDSWQERSSSLVVGFNLAFLNDGSTLLFGMGVGQSNLILWDNARLEAVWSVLLTYLYEQGIVGVIAAVWVGLQLVEVWRRTKFRSAYLTVSVVWLIGMTITTSYEQLLPTWVFLGWMTVWRDIMQDGRVESSRSGLVGSDQPTSLLAELTRPSQPGIARRGLYAD